MTELIECAKLVRPMQKEEWINTFLIEVTLNPKITNLQLAEKYHCCRNTVSKYRKIIRERQLRTNVEIVNKIDNVLEDRIADMENRDLINYRRSVAPEERHVIGELTETKRVLHLHMWRPGDEPSDTSNKVSVSTIRETGPVPQ